MKSIFIIVITNHIFFSKVEDRRKGARRKYVIYRRKSIIQVTDCSPDGLVDSNCSAVPERERYPGGSRMTFS